MMKCNKCGSEWKTDAGRSTLLTICLFCQENLTQDSTLKSFDNAPQPANISPDFQAVPVVTQTAQSKPSPEKAGNGIAATPKVGSIMPFSGIDWCVLDVQNGQALLLSSKILEERSYHSDVNGATWAVCELHDYLNGAFYDSFGQEDKLRIAETKITTNDNPWYETKGGIAVSDRIFLLSIEEVVRYFGDSGDLKNRKGWFWRGGKLILKDGKGWVINDQYNDARIAEYRNSEASLWWLRSPGSCGRSAAGIGIGGGVSIMGYNVSFGSGGVRPALWLNL